MLTVKLRKSVGTMDRELVKEGRKFNTYKITCDDFDSAIAELAETHDIEFAVGWLTGYSSKGAPLRMKFVEILATSVTISDKDTGKTLLKWSK